MGGCGDFGLAGGVSGLVGSLIGVLLFAGLIVMLFVGLIGLVAFVVLKVLPAQGAGGARLGFRTEPAEDLLRGRFARGEISAEEYERSMRTLRGEISGGY